MSCFKYQCPVSSLLFSPFHFPSLSFLILISYFSFVLVLLFAYYSPRHTLVLTTSDIYACHITMPVFLERMGVEIHITLSLFNSYHSLCLFPPFDDPVLALLISYSVISYRRSYILSSAIHAFLLLLVTPSHIISSYAVSYLPVSFFLLLSYHTLSPHCSSVLSETLHASSRLALRPCVANAIRRTSLRICLISPPCSADALPIRIWFLRDPFRYILILADTICSL